VVQATDDRDPPAAEPGHDPVLDDVLRAMFRVVQQIKQTVHADQVERQAIIILSRLRHNGSIRLSELASDLLVDISTVSRQVRALEDRGLVARSEDPDDRRASRIVLAPAGGQVLDEAWARRHAWLERSLSDWAPEEREALSSTLTRFADALAAPPVPPALDRGAPAPPAPPASAPAASKGSTA
jgi:DNA-binding MarR family transcriptional regulator